jgi:hypothetical protein
MLAQYLINGILYMHIPNKNFRSYSFVQMSKQAVLSSKYKGHWGLITKARIGYWVILQYRVTVAVKWLHGSVV